MRVRAVLAACLAACSAPDAAVTLDAGAPDAPAPSATAGPQLFGRWETSDPARPRANWSGSTVAAVFTGTEVGVTLEVSGVADLYFMAVVDDRAPRRFKASAGRASTSLASGLAAGTHTVRVSLETEGSYGVMRFISFDLGSGRYVAQSAARPRRIEVIGDSITCGYGNIGPPTIQDASNNWSAPTCPWSTATESAYMAYGAVLGRLLDADVTTVCYSGKGVYMDAAGQTDSASNPQLPALYRDALCGVGWNGVDLHEFPYPATGATPPGADVVVVNLGTNDISGATRNNGGATTLPPADAWRAAYLALLARVRANHPGAHIFLTLGSMTGDPALSGYRALLDTVVAATGDPKVRRVDMDVQDPSKGVGCDWHPTAATDAIMAKRLAAQIGPIIGVTPRAADPNPYVAP